MEYSDAPLDMLQHPRIQEYHEVWPTVRDFPASTSPEARRTAPGAVGLSAGVARVPAGCGWPPSDRDGRLPVRLTCQRRPPPSASTGPDLWASPSTQRASWRRLYGRQSCGPGSTVPAGSAQVDAARLWLGRTRWSCATLAMELTGKHGLAVCTWTVRRWRPAWGWGWKRATLVATAAEPQRVERLAQIRL